MDVSLSTWDSGDWTVVVVAGEVDVYTAPKLREKVTEVVDLGRHRVVVDLEQVTFMDSTGLGVLVGCLRRVRVHDGRLRLVCTSDRILRLFRLTGLNKVFSCHGSVEAAMEDGA